MRFFTSDTHFGHKNIIKYCDRPFKDVPHMNEQLVERWNAVVSNDDWVFHLGDVALGPWTEWDGLLTRLNGNKVLVIGNHDRIFKGESEKNQVRFMPEYEKWFDIITDRAQVELANGVEAELSHFPYDGDSHGGERYREFRTKDNGKVLIHGHTHMNQKVSYSNKGTLQIHVGADAWDFTPVSEDQVINAIEGLE